MGFDIYFDQEVKNNAKNMKLKIVQCLVLSLLFAGIAFTQEPRPIKIMKRIKLLSDNRQDIINLLGNPRDDEKESSIWDYDFPEGTLSVSFESGKCIISPDTGEPVGWKVPEWTVSEVAFSFDEPIKPKKLGISFSNFKATPVHDVSGSFEYFSEELGIYYITDSGKIQTMRFIPPKKYYFLECK